MATKTATESKEQQQVNRLYDISTKLDTAGSDIGKQEELYKEILGASKGPDNAKKLAAQLIPRYFKSFPKLNAKSIDAMIDLCEDEDVQIRINAYRGFPQICKDDASVLPKVADVLGQLLQTDVIKELDTVKHTLVTLLSIDAKGVLQALFHQIITRDEIQRDKATQFIKEKVYPTKDEIIKGDEDLEKFIAENLKKIMKDLHGEDYKIFMNILTGLKIYKGENAKELLDFVADMADLKADFKPTDVDNIEKLISCFTTALPFIQTHSASEKFFEYLSSKVLPEFDKVPDAHKLPLLKCLSEMTPYAKAPEARIMLPSIYSMIKSHVPAVDSADFKFNFSLIECLLFIFHQLASKTPGTLKGLCGIAIMTGQPSDFETVEDAPAKLADLQKRLKLLDSKAKGLVDQLNKGTGAAAQTALKTTENVRELVKTLILPKPTFVSAQKMKLSWQQKEKRKAEENKPKTTTTTKTEGPAAKKQREVYTPPAVRANRGGRGGRGGNNNRGGKPRNFRGKF